VSELLLSVIECVYTVTDVGQTAEPSVSGPSHPEVETVEKV
jgi:hypothetical protein